MNTTHMCMHMYMCMCMFHSHKHRRQKLAQPASLSRVFSPQTAAPLHFVCQVAAILRVVGETGFYCRSIGERRSPIEVCSRLHELRCRARPHLPSVTLPH